MLLLIIMTTSVQGYQPHFIDEKTEADNNWLSYSWFSSRAGIITCVCWIQRLDLFLRHHCLPRSEIFWWSLGAPYGLSDFLEIKNILFLLWGSLALNIYIYIYIYIYTDFSGFEFSINIPYSIFFLKSHLLGKVRRSPGSVLCPTQSVYSPASWWGRWWSRQEQRWNSCHFGGASLLVSAGRWLWA